MSTIRNFIIVDDDHFNNIICIMTIEDTLPGVETKAFTAPEKALEYLQYEFIQSSNSAILLLDINMPTLSGWEFIEKFDNFSDEVKSKTFIYILSSSVDQRDIDKANSSKHIKGFISKPLHSEMVVTLAGTRNSY